MSFNEFLEKYQNQCDFILVGPYQNGKIEGRDGLRIPVCRLDGRWFV